MVKRVSIVIGLVMIMISCQNFDEYVAKFQKVYENSTERNYRQ